MKTSEKKESSFKSMFEKNTKDTKTDKESVEHTLDEMNESTASKNEDMQEEQTKVAQALAQYVACLLYTSYSNQRKLILTGKTTPKK